MADAETIKEFFVGIKYAPDETSATRFRQGLGQAATATTALQKSIDAAAKALGELGAALKKTSDEPARQYEESQRRMAVRQTEHVKLSQELARIAVITATAFARGIFEVAKNYEQLYYLAQRVGTTVEDISKVAAGFGAVGKGAGEAQAAIASLGQAMRSSPPIGQWVQSIAGTADPAKAFAPMMKYPRTLPLYLAEQLGQERLGWSKELVDSFMPPGVIEKFEEREKKMGALLDDLKSHGVDTNKIAQQSAEFGATLNAIGQDLNLIWVEVAGTVLPVLNPLLHTIDDLLQVLLKWNAQHPGAAVAEELGALAVGATGALAAFRLFFGFVSGRTTLLRGLFTAFGTMFRTTVIGAILIGLYELYDHWDDLNKAAREKTPRQWAEIGAESGKSFVDSIAKFFAGGDLKNALKSIDQALTDLIPAFAKAGAEAANAFVEQIPVIGSIIRGLGYGAALPGIIGAERGMPEAAPRQSPLPPAQPAAPAPAPLGPEGVPSGEPPGFQRGGIVTINAHEGEMVLPEPISRGLQAMIRAVQGVGPAFHAGSERADERLSNWLTGMGGTVPRIIIENVDDFVQQLLRAQKEQGKEGDAGGGGAAGGGAAEGEPTSDTVQGPPPPPAAPTTIGGRIGGAIGGAARAVTGAVTGAAQAVRGFFTGGGVLKAGPGGAVAPQDLYRAAVERFKNSPLNGYVPKDGATFGITKGTPEEWARLSLAIGMQESSLQANAPGGGLFQMERADLARRGVQGDVNDPNAQFEATAREFERTIPKAGFIKGPGNTGLSEYFGSIRRPQETLRHMAAAEQVAQQAQREPMTAGPVSPGFPTAAPQVGEISREPGAQMVQPQAVPMGAGGARPGAANAPRQYDPNDPRGAYGVPGAVMNYGGTGAVGTAAQAAANMVPIKVPGTNRTVMVHKDAAAAFTGYLSDLAKTGYNLKDVQTYADRKMRGGEKPSEHSFGLALDVNPNANVRGVGGTTDLPPNLHELAAKWGLISGADWRGKDYDPMHVQWAGPKAAELAAARRAQGDPTAALQQPLPPRAQQAVAALQQPLPGGQGRTVTPETNMPPWARNQPTVPETQVAQGRTVTPETNMPPWERNHPAIGRTVTPETNRPSWAEAGARNAALLDRNMTDTKLTNQSTTNNGGDTVTNEGDRTATMNVTNNISVQGDGGMGTQDAGSRYSRAQTRIYGDLMRNFKTQMA
jgi:hypothetical protein